MQVSKADAVKQIQRLERTIKYPEDKESFERLVEAFRRACEKYEVNPKILMDEICQIAKHCPSDYELFKAAEALQKIESWHPSAPVRCTKCDGTGWEHVYMLHTHEGTGDYAYVKKEHITKAVFNSFNGGKLDPQKQSVYSGARQCDHQNQPASAWTQEAREEHDAKWAAFIASNCKLATGKKPAVKDRGFKRAGEMVAHLMDGYGTELRRAEAPVGGQFGKEWE